MADFNSEVNLLENLYNQKFREIQFDIEEIVLKTELDHYKKMKKKISINRLFNKEAALILKNYNQPLEIEVRLLNSVLEKGLHPLINLFALKQLPFVFKIQADFELYKQEETLRRLQYSFGTNSIYHRSLANMSPVRYQKSFYENMIDIYGSVNYKRSELGISQGRLEDLLETINLIFDLDNNSNVQNYSTIYFNHKQSIRYGVRPLGRSSITPLGRYSIAQSAVRFNTISAIAEQLDYFLKYEFNDIPVSNHLIDKKMVKKELAKMNNWTAHTFWNYSAGLTDREREAYVAKLKVFEKSPSFIRRPFHQMIIHNSKRPCLKTIELISRID